VEYAANERRALLRFNAGDWTAFPPVNDTPFFLVDSEDCYALHRIWDSPPEEDPQPYPVEMVPRTEKSGICCVVQ